MNKRTYYKDRGYCCYCRKWIPIEQLKKVYIKKLGVYALYCPIHLKQVRLKPRTVKMGEVPTRR
jgi:hypothetical protein